MRTTIKYNAILLLCVLALSLTCTQSKAQNYLRVDFKNSNRKSIALHQDSIARIEFEYKNSIPYTAARPHPSSALLRRISTRPLWKVAWHIPTIS